MAYVKIHYGIEKGGGRACDRHLSHDTYLRCHGDPTLRAIDRDRESGAGKRPTKTPITTNASTTPIRVMLSSVLGSTPPAIKTARRIKPNDAVNLIKTSVYYYTPLYYISQAQKYPYF